MSQVLRSKRRRGLTVALVAALSAAGALTIWGAFGAHSAAPRTGPLTIHAGLENPPGAFVRGNGLFAKNGGRSQLVAAVSGAMIGPLSSDAPSPAPL